MRLQAICAFILCCCGAFSQQNPAAMKSVPNSKVPSSSEQSGVHPPIVIDCSKSECQLPVATSEEMYGALHNAFITSKHADLGFPVDLIAASYGLRDSGWSVTWKPLKFKKSKIQATFRTIKRYGKDEVKLPALVAVALPSLGYHIYDASVIRTLFRTDLFPYDSQVIDNSTKDGKLALVKVDQSKGGEAKEVFQYLSEHAAVSEATSMAKPSALSRTELPIGFAGHIQLVAYVSKDAGQSKASPVNTNQAGTASTGPLFMPSWLPWLPVYTARVKMGVGPWKCSKLTGGEKEAAEKLNGKIWQTGCLLPLSVELPAGTDAGYEDILLAGRVGNQPIACSPKEFDDPKNAGIYMLGCRHTAPEPNSEPEPDFEWSISKSRLQGELRSNKATEPFQVAAPSASNLVIGLMGKRLGLFATPIVSCWCSDKICSAEQLKVCSDFAK